ncbi:TonB-dependent receptor plug domain-containing protein, partial [Vibrio parahaemolyticus]
SFVGPTQATVGQYWGNSRITYSAPDPSLRLYDVERVEVLEGPQGTLYGAGSLGGVVRVVPRAPDLTAFGGQAWGGVQAVQHGGLGGDGGAILNLPVAPDRAALRALFFAST